MTARARRNRTPDPTLTRRRRGQALIEMAIVVTVLMTIVIGMIDFGIFFYRHVQAANCVREEARRAVVDVEIPEESYCVDAELIVTVTEDGENVVATVNEEHTWIALDMIIPGFDGPPIRARAEMRIET